MKNNLFLIGSAIWIGVAVLFAFLVLLPSSRLSFASENTIRKEESFSMTDIERLVVTTIMTKIEFAKSDDEQLHVLQYDNDKMSNDFVMNRNGDTILIDLDDKRFIPFGFFNKKLIVKLPKSWHGSLEASNTSGGIRSISELELNKLFLECSSGGIHFDESLSVLSDVALHTSSGGIRLAAINSGGSLSLSTSSGGIRISGDVTGKSIQAVTSSGGIQMESVYVQDFDFESSSGAITTSIVSGSGNMRANSGGIRTAISSDTGDIKLKTSSGGIRISTHGTFPLSFKANTSSGKISAFFELSYKNQKGNSVQGQVGTNPSTFIECNASSGGVEITLIK